MLFSLIRTENLTHIKILTNGFSHHYQLDESTFIFGGVRCDFYFLSHFSMNFFVQTE